MRYEKGKREARGERKAKGFVLALCLARAFSCELAEISSAI